ncbi:MAG TPA: hypothetical protein VGX76_22650 [Pirellulales bacterium]|jgi:hypothetical protein|nr:hypothetical protein [Pirellulales bacterium]
MTDIDELLALYLHLARASELRNRPWVRDKLLVLAGACAVERGLDLIAAFCRRRILSNNPGHLVGHHPSLAMAMDDERFQGYLVQLRRRYSRERAEHMLRSLGIDLAHERDAYFTLYEYAAALLGTTPVELNELFGDVDLVNEAVSATNCPVHERPTDDRLASAKVYRPGRSLWIVWGVIGSMLLGAAVLAWLG